MKQTKKIKLFNLLLLQSYVMQLSASVYLTYSCSALVFFQRCLLGRGCGKELKNPFFYPLPIRCKINGCKTSNLQLSFSHWHDKVRSSHSPTYKCVSAFTLCSVIFCPVRQIGIYINFSSYVNSTYTHVPIELWQCMQLCAYRTCTSAYILSVHSTTKWPISGELYTGYYHYILSLLVHTFLYEDLWKCK